MKYCYDQQMGEIIIDTQAYTEMNDQQLDILEESGSCRGMSRK